jgi:hypothetical protein
MEESLLLTTVVVSDFRKAYPEVIAQWERQIGEDNCHPDLHFCLYLIDEFPKLRAYLSMLDYRFDFAINAYITHSNYERTFIASGYDDVIAMEMANYELKLTYKVLNDSTDMDNNPKLMVYYSLLEDEYH